jgi:hypothetical protein
MASEVSEMSKQGTAGIRKNVTFNVCQKLGISGDLKVVRVEERLWITNCP